MKGRYEFILSFPIVLRGFTNNGYKKKIVTVGKLMPR